MKENHQQAADLKRLLSVLFTSALHANAEVSAAHEATIQSITVRTKENTDILEASLTAAIGAMKMLGNQMVACQTP